MKVLFKNLSNNNLEALQDYLLENQKIRKINLRERDLGADALAFYVSSYDKYTALIISGELTGWCCNALVIDDWTRAIDFVSKLKRV